MLLPTIKSPLRYPGGKSRAVKIIFQHIPFNTTEICSPFFGGGSFELYCASKGIRVYGYDNFEPLVKFWQWILKDPEKLASAVDRFYPLNRSEFYKLQNLHTEITDSFEQAVMFYVLNRTSFSGSTLSGGMASGGLYDNPRFTRTSIERLRNFRIKNVSIELSDFKQSIAKHPNTLLYLDPPYNIDSKLYGINGDLHKNFDHESLASIIKKRDKWILSYNNSITIKNIYHNYQIVYPKWTYGMATDKSSREILILSNDLRLENK